jgi:hypothetical protein
VLASAGGAGILDTLLLTQYHVSAGGALGRIGANIGGAG